MSPLSIHIACSGCWERLRAIAAARNMPLIPPADVPDTMSTTTFVRTRSLAAASHSSGS